MAASQYIAWCVTELCANAGRSASQHGAHRLNVDLTLLARALCGDLRRLGLCWGGLADIWSALAGNFRRLFVRKLLAELIESEILKVELQVV